MSGGLRFDITLADGRTLRDVRIQGSGGEIGSGVLHVLGGPHGADALAAELGRVRALVRYADAGRRLPITEPSPGHVRLYIGPWQGCLDDEVSEDVPLAGARVELHSPAHVLCVGDCWG